MYINIDGCRIYYEEAGKGRPLIFLHGWGVSGEIFKPLFLTLARSRLVRVIDFPGFGNSAVPDMPEDNVWGTSEYGGLLLNILDEWGWKGADALAHSFGCRVAVRALAKEPSALGKLLFTGAAGLRRNVNISFTKKALVRAGKIAGSFGPPGAWLKERIYAKTGSADYLASSGVMRKVLVKTVNEDLSGLLPGIRNETLLLWGENDTATPMESGREFERLMPNARLVTVAGAGHYPFIEKREEFLRHANQFFGAAS